MTTRTIVVDGLSVEMADKDAQIVQRTIDGLEKRLRDGETAAATAKDAHDKALAAKDTAHQAALAAKDATIADKDKALAAKDAEIDGLKAKVLDAAALDKRVAERADLIAKAKSVAPKIVTDGLEDAAIRKAAVAAVLGDAKIADKADAYIDARFDILVEDAAKADPIRAAATATPSNDAANVTADAAWSGMVTDMTSAWQKKRSA